MTQKLEALHLEAICEAVRASCSCSNQGWNSQARHLEDENAAWVFISASWFSGRVGMVPGAQGKHRAASCLGAEVPSFPTSAVIQAAPLA